MDKTVSDLCAEYISSREDAVKQSTTAAYNALYRNHIQPQFSGVKVDELTKETVTAYYKNLADAGYSDTHIHSIGILLRSAYTYGAETYGIENVVKPAHLPRMRRKAVSVLTDEERRKVLKGDNAAALIALSMGLRIGEVCGLMAEDVADGVLTVRRTVQRIQDSKGSTRLIVTQPKTVHSQRQIPVPKHIKTLLTAQPKRYIIGGETEPTEPRMIQYHWSRFCRENGMRNINFHTLRHTFATQALEAGVDVKTLSEMLGHASTSTTMDLYCHPTMKHKKDCMDKLWRLSDE